MPAHRWSWSGRSSKIRLHSFGRESLGKGVYVRAQHGSEGVSSDRHRAEFGQGSCAGTVGPDERNTGTGRLPEGHAILVHGRREIVMKQLLVIDCGIPRSEERNGRTVHVHMSDVQSRDEAVL